MNAIRTAATEPPPAPGKFQSRDDLERRAKEYEDEAGRALARAASLKEYIERVWGES